MSTMRVSVDAAACMSTRTCMDIAPELFEIAAAGHATPRSAEVEESDELLDAEGSCPAAAITVVPST